MFCIFALRLFNPKNSILSSSTSNCCYVSKVWGLRWQIILAYCFRKEAIFTLNFLTNFLILSPIFFNGYFLYNPFNIYFLRLVKLRSKLENESKKRSLTNSIWYPNYSFLWLRWLSLTMIIDSSSRLTILLDSLYTSIFL